MGEPRTPRQYQLELLDYVTERNAIIYLPTGAGKTFVAVMAIKRFSPKLQKTIENGGKRAIFMCNTVELARQQAIELKSSTNLKVGFYVGERGTDNWTRSQWQKEITDNQLLVGTAQIFVDLVSQNILKINDLVIVVIDECHHATGDHPMFSFMRLFERADQARLPRVIGLTGVLIKGNKLDNIEQQLTKLEATYRGNIITVSTQEAFQSVLLYSTKPQEELAFFVKSRTISSTETQIIDTINYTMKIIDGWSLGAIPMKYTKNLGDFREPSKKNTVKNFLKDFLFQMEEFGLFAASYAIMALIIEFEVKKRSADTISLRDMYRFVITQCEYVRRVTVKRLMDTVDDDDANEAMLSQKYVNMDAIEQFSTAKMLAFLCYVDRNFANKSKKDIRSLVFVDRRYTARCVYLVLEAFLHVRPKLKEVIRPQFMVGRHCTMASVESILEQKWNRTAVEDFRKGVSNMIICSNVLEEGIDIQGCNYVCTLDPLKTFNSYIQTKGRARSKESTYTVFTPKCDQTKVATQLMKYQKAYEFIKEFLVGRTLDRDDPSRKAIASCFADTIPPFAVPSGAVLLAPSALSLLHRYCQMLPSDSFGVSVPWYSKKELKNGKIVVSINLPLQSTVKEKIEGDPMDTVRDAKITAAFKACKRLYENKELNDKLLPVTRRECVEQVSAQFFSHWKKFNDKVSKDDMQQSRRSHDRLCPKELYQAMPEVGRICYAYEIKLIPKFERNAYNEHAVHLLNGPTNFAILLNKKLPRLAEMPLFTNQGELKCQIESEPMEVMLKHQSELDKLLGFHVMLMRDILKTWKQYFVIDRRNKENSFLLTPVNRAKGCIDWATVEEFQQLAPVRKYTVAERKQMVFRPEDYMNKVVVKWYGELNRSVFIVTKVRTDATPLSPFSTSDYANYADYMEKKYGSDINHIVNKDQFLVDVKQVTSRRNFYNNAKGKAKEINRMQDAITLIPETLCNLRFPGELWFKAVFLQSIMCRLHYMLHAEELRVRIDRFLGFQTQSEYKPKPLIIDVSLRRAVDVDGNVIDEIEPEPKKMLDQLVKPEIQKATIENSLTTETWKAYLEPADCFREPLKVHSVELNYYYNFVSGMINDLPDLEKGDEIWTKSQLKIPSPKRTPRAKAMNQNRASLALTMGDQTPKDPRTLHILERSLGAEPLEPAEQFEYLAAITTAVANDVFDMERFELLGDSFLKLAGSLLFVNKFPHWHEGFFTTVKSKFVSNRNLLYCMLGTDIPQRIAGTIFMPGSWLPPCVSLPNNLLQRYKDAGLQHSTALRPLLYNLELTEAQVKEGNCGEDQVKLMLAVGHKARAVNQNQQHVSEDNHLNAMFNKQTLRDKVVSDTLEALLGVCVKNYGIFHSYRMLEFFGLCKSERGFPLEKMLVNLNVAASMRTNISPKEVDAFLLNHDILETNLGYKFRDRSYLLQALTHPSYPTNRLTGCYQVLEFIGDAILDFLVSSYIYEQHASMTPGQLTDLRSALVNNITLGCVCVRHRFHLFILAENAVLNDSIKNFDKFQETQDYRVSDQVRVLMEEEPLGVGDDDEDLDEEEQAETPNPFNLAVNVDVPKALGDVVEALIAAVFLDSRDLRTTWNVIHYLLDQELNDFTRKIPIDAVRRLEEYKHADPKFSNAVFENGHAMVTCEFTCLNQRKSVNGFAGSAAQAKKAAAKHALKILDKQAD